MTKFISILNLCSLVFSLHAFAGGDEPAEKTRYSNTEGKRESEDSQEIKHSSKRFLLLAPVAVGGETANLSGGVLPDYPSLLKITQKFAENSSLQLRDSIVYTYPSELIHDSHFIAAIGLDPSEMKEHLAHKPNFTLAKNRITLQYMQGKLGQPGKLLVTFTPHSVEPPHDFAPLARNYTFGIVEKNSLVPHEVGNIRMTERMENGKPIIYLANIHVDEDHRGKGFSTTGLADLVRFYDQPSFQSAEKMTLNVSSDNPAAALIYARAGFQLNSAALHELHSVTGIPAQDIRAILLKDSTVRNFSSYCKEKQGGGITEEDQSQLEKISHLIEEALEMERPRGRPGISISTQASTEEIKRACSHLDGR